MAWVFSKNGQMALNLDRYTRAVIEVNLLTNRWEIVFHEVNLISGASNFQVLDSFDTHEQAEEFLSEAFLYARGGGWSR